MRVSESGPWKVHSGTVVSPNGVTEVTVINDGETEWWSAANPKQLVVALMQHLRIERISAVDGEA